MVLDAVANFVRGNTDAAVDNSQTTISVVDASIFPDPSVQGEYNVVIWDAATYPRPDQDPDTEILRVTAIDTVNDNLTVVRGQETTTPASHPSGSAVHLSPTAKMFSDIKNEYTASGENFDGEGTSEFTNLQSVSTEKQNNTKIAAPGEVQSKIDELNSDSNIGVGYNKERGIVKLQPNKIYDESGEITVYPGIDLNFNGAVLTHSSDHNIIFQDNGTRVYNAMIWVDPDTYTSDAVVWDTSRSTYGKYTVDSSGGQENSQSEFYGAVFGDPAATLSSDTQGTALHLNDANGVGITIGSKVNLTASGLGQGLHASIPSGGFVNFDDITVSLSSCHTLINQTGADEFRSHIKGELQPTVVTEYGIRNQTSDNSVVFTGQFWDPSNAGTNALDGSEIVVNTKTKGVESFSGNTSEEFGQLVSGWSGGNSFNVLDDTGNYWEMVIFGANIELRRPNLDSRKIIWTLTGNPEVALQSFGGDRVKLYIDAGELKAEDNAGNVTTLT